MTLNSYVVRLCFTSGLAMLGAATSGGNTQFWDVPRFASDGMLVYKAATEMKVAPGTKDAILEREYRVEFDSEGKQKTSFYLIYKIENQDGVDGWDSLEASWEPWHENRPTARARVITASGEIHELDPKTIVDAVRDERENGEYTDRKKMTAPLPAAGAGSVVEEELAWEETKPEFSAGTVGQFEFGGEGVPEAHCRLVLSAPSALPLRYELQKLPNMKPQKTEANGRVEIVFEQADLVGLEAAENYLPSDVAAYPGVFFSTGTSWKGTAETYGRIVDEQIQKASISGLAAKITAGKNGRDEKITAILQYLDREVRYTGVEFGDAAIVPASPDETLKRQYGDCKDKSTLLIAMLRAAGIPSYVALLRIGTRQDVPANLPGMGAFDHAIVFVPGRPEYWIDATDTDARLGELATADQGRLTLIARAGSDSLMTTPVSKSEDNLQLEERSIYLADNGPARIIEVTRPHGWLESVYRNEYRDTQNKDARKQLSDYMRTEYLADKLDRFETSGGEDITTQFSLTLESRSAKRGTTDLNSAAAAIRIGPIFGRLPDDFRQELKKEGEAAANNGTDKPARTDDWVLGNPFVTEWKYSIYPPEGFQIKALPDNQTIGVGPAQLTEQFVKDDDGVVHADIRFDTVRGRFTAAEEKEMQKKIVELADGSAILVNFELKAEALIRAGKPREAFQVYRDAIAASPNESMNHLRFGEALLNAGFGKKARDEARLAVRLAPNSALAQKELANVLEFDLVGRKFAIGSDYAGAEAAYRTAMKLDPNDKAIRVNLAILLEFNRYGERYAPGSRLKEAVALYQALKPEDLHDLGVAANLAYTLFYGGEFADARKYAETLNPVPLTVVVASEAAVNGSKAGIAEALKRAENENTQKSVLGDAADMLVTVRLYPQAADLIEAGTSGQNASRRVAFAKLVRSAKRHEDLRTGETPVEVAMGFYLAMANSGDPVETISRLHSRNAKVVEKLADAEEIEAVKQLPISMREQLEKIGFHSDAMFDVYLPASDPKISGDDANGYKVAVNFAGVSKKAFFVVKEDGKYRILDATPNPGAIGLEILDRVAAGNSRGARFLLDSLRDEEQLRGGDDPLAGPVFPRAWTEGADADATHMKLAAGAILTSTRMTAAKGVALLESLEPSLSDSSDKLNCELALVAGYQFQLDFAKILPIASDLHARYPLSIIAFYAEERALRALGRSAEGDGLAQDRLKAKPGDVYAYRMLTDNATSRGEYAKARELAQTELHAEKADAYDMNKAGWLAMFSGMADSDIDSATEAVRATSERDAAYLHTLACLYAVSGKTKQARDMFVEAMNLLHMHEPLESYAYGFGLIAEQFGELDIALEDYAKLSRPNNPNDEGESTYYLAQLRLKALRDSSSASTKKN